MSMKKQSLRNKLFVCAILALPVILAACGGQAFPEPPPLAAADLTSLTLVPYVDEDLAIRGVVPDGWIEAYPDAYTGVFISGPPESRPSATLLQRLEAGLTLDQAKGAWLTREGEDEFPMRAGSRETPNFTWELYCHTTEGQRGPTSADIALAETRDGVYTVELWAPAGENEALHQAVFLPVVDALAPATAFPSRYEAYGAWPVVASIEEVGDKAHETAEFTLETCTRLRLYAIGEASQGEMVDYGYVEDAGTGQVVWQMYIFETDSAGYYRNRRADRPLTLPAGTYRLHFRTNGTHSASDWGDRPPGHSFWGIALFEEPVSASNPAVCWPRAERPEELGWSMPNLEGIVPELERLKVAALMVVTDGQVAFEWGNTAVNFQAHSMRKSLLSALYGVYVGEGKIDISKTLAELGLDDLTPLTDAEKQATVRELLQARSGVYIPAGGESEGMAAGRPERGDHEHGSHWYYNNWDFNALGSIFDTETGESGIYQAFEARIAVPTGMQDFFPERLSYQRHYLLSQHPYYGFRISARDLARLGQLFLQEGQWEGIDGVSSIVPASWVAESTRPYSRTGRPGTYSGYGYMWWVAAEDMGAIQKGSYCASGHGGHTLEVLPHLGTVVVIRFNTDVPGYENLAGGAADGLILEILEARREPK